MRVSVRLDGGLWNASERGVGDVLTIVGNGGGWGGEGEERCCSFIEGRKEGRKEVLRSFERGERRRDLGRAFERFSIEGEGLGKEKVCSSYLCFLGK